MSCYRPVTAWKPSDGPIVFSEKKDCREIKIACGQCIGCRIAKRDAWAVRCLCEAQLSTDNMFLTLTYDDAHYPQYGSLNYRDFQLFAKRMRKQCGPFRFFVAGEYGEELSRPHYHALVFGLRLSDLVKCNSIRSSCDIYRSETLEKLWPLGFSSVGDVTLASARYTAAYICKKITGDLADSHYSRVVPSTGEIVQLEPEFARMSLRPGIGAMWLEKYWRDLYMTGHNAVIVDGKRKKIPRYFDDYLAENIAPLVMDDVEYQRFLKADSMRDEFTPARLEAREKVELARVKFEKERRGNFSEI